MAVTLPLIIGVAVGICVLNVILGLTWYTYKRNKVNDDRKHRMLCFPQRQPSPLRAPKSAPSSISSSTRRTPETGQPQQQTTQLPDRQSYMDIMYSLHLAHREKLAKKLNDHSLASTTAPLKPYPYNTPPLQASGDPKAPPSAFRQHPPTSPGLPTRPASEREISLRSFDTASLYSVASAAYEIPDSNTQSNNLGAMAQPALDPVSGQYAWPNWRRPSVIREELAPETYTKVKWKVPTDHESSYSGSSPPAQRSRLSTVYETADLSFSRRNRTPNYSTPMVPLKPDGSFIPPHPSSLIIPPPPSATSSHHQFQSSGQSPPLQQSLATQLPYTSSIGSSHPQMPNIPMRSPLRSLHDPQLKPSY